MRTPVLRVRGHPRGLTEPGLCRLGGRRGELEGLSHVLQWLGRELRLAPLARVLDPFLQVPQELPAPLRLAPSAGSVGATESPPTGPPAWPPAPCTNKDAGAAVPLGRSPGCVHARRRRIAGAALAGTPPVHRSSAMFSPGDRDETTCHRFGTVASGTCHPSLLPGG